MSLMIRNYLNKKIYKNLKVAKVLHIIALIMAVLIVIYDIFQRCMNSQNSILDRNQVLFFYMYTLLIPICGFNSTKTNRQKSIVAKDENEFNNDFSHLLIQIIISFLPYIFLILDCLIFISFGFFNIILDFFNPAVLAYVCGSMLPSHIFVYIADGFLIHNCVLIKREWKYNPPDFVKNKQAEIIDERTKTITDRNMKQYKTLIEKCGIKFFIKYYEQINCLPLRDVNIVENYCENEREERLLAAKKIIELDLTEFALNEILNTYSNILDTHEIEQVKSILAGLQSNKK